MQGNDPENGTSIRCHDDGIMVAADQTCDAVRNLLNRALITQLSQKLLNGGRVFGVCGSYFDHDRPAS